MADTFYHNWAYEMGAKNVNMAASGDVFKLALFTNSKVLEPDDVTYSTTNELPTANGYTQGGYAFTNTNSSWTDVDGSNYALFDIAEDAQWADSTLTARYAQLYDSTYSSRLVCLFDFGSDKSTSAGLFKVVFNATGILTLT